MKKVCIDLTSLDDNFSGIERFALSISKELIKNKNFQFILFFKNKIHGEFQDEQKNVKKLIIKGTNKLLFYQLILPCNLKRIKADYYLFPAFPAPFFFFNKHSISAIHDVSCWDCPGSNKKYMLLYFKIMYWKAAQKNKQIITVSEFSKNRIVDILKIKAENVEVIYNGLAQNFFRVVDEKEKEIVKQKYNLPKEYILCLSTLEPRKNLQILIKAYTRFVDKTKFDLVLAGRKGWMMENVLSNLPENVKKRIHFTGFVEDEDLAGIYKSATWFVFPSLYEGFGIPPLEAMAAKTPVISSDASSMPEVLGKAAIFFKNNNVDDLMEKLNYAFNVSSAQYDMLVKRGISQAQLYDWDKSARKLINLFK